MCWILAAVFFHNSPRPLAQGASIKHLTQANSIASALARHGVLALPNPSFIEYGAGKAFLTYWLREAYGWQRPAGTLAALE